MMKVVNLDCFGEAQGAENALFGKVCPAAFVTY
jgi:hypothetical protein